MISVSNPLISIITVAYNAEGSIDKTIKSVINQTCSNYEYLIIDGASTDNTLKVIEKNISFENNPIKLISEPDNGIYDAMNKAIKLAKGKWIYFLNAGDLLINDSVIEAISNIIEEYSNQNLGLIYGNIITYDSCRQRIGRKVKLKDFKRKMVIGHQAAFANREEFELIGLYNTEYKIIADYDWFIRFFKNNGKSLYVNKDIAFYDMDGFSMRNMLSIESEKLSVLKNNFGMTVFLFSLIKYPIMFLKVKIITYFEILGIWKFYRKLKLKIKGNN